MSVGLLEKTETETELAHNSGDGGLRSASLRR
jgi:hypothetical protein